MMNNEKMDEFVEDNIYNVSYCNIGYKGPSHTAIAFGVAGLDDAPVIQSALPAKLSWKTKIALFFWKIKYKLKRVVWKIKELIRWAAYT
jgi:hypothetical protein